MRVMTAHAIGLWKADSCSTAKGVVGVRNKDGVLLDAFRGFLESRKLGVKSRDVFGFSKTSEVYTCNSALKREFERAFARRACLSLNERLAYFGGRIDGDGTVDAKSSHMRIYYSHKEAVEASEDAEMLRSIGQDAIVKYYNVPTLCIRRPRNFAKIILRFVRSERKRKELLEMNK